MNPLPQFQLTGKVALITGASKGIGEAMARLFAAQGAIVVINSRKQDELDLVANSIRENGGTCTPIAALTTIVLAIQDWHYAIL